ncbi:MAG: DEAD/DEAH box helicase [Anaerolineae bacterium]
MNPIELAQKLQAALVSYLTTTFDVNRDGQEPELAAAIEASFNLQGALFNGPYLELTPPYRTRRSLKALCEQGVLSEQLLQLECFSRGMPIPVDTPLFTHQERAIRKLVIEQHNVVISSGTGSGKTECFLIPILNDLLSDATPGVRALLIYPMNALVNDQLDRLRSLLAGTDITFGRYTSELMQTEEEALRHTETPPLPNEVICRDHIQSGEKLPQILITNYAMLEYLLLRPKDSPLFESGRWRYIVLDEAHTYVGAQGIEVAMLLRRLKHRLGKRRGEIRCVATSATLTDDDATEAATFAACLFDEPFDEDDIIFGEIDTAYFPEAETAYEVPRGTYNHPEFGALLAEIRNEDGPDTDAIALRMNEFGLISDEMVAYADRHRDDAPAFLWHVLQGNRDLIALREWMLARRDDPVRVEEAAEQILGELDVDARLEALYHLIELGAIARPAPDKPPLLPARYHLFVRAPQGIWVCLNPLCPGKESSNTAGWARMFASRHETCDACGCTVYPISVCRECGQVYIQAKVQHKRWLPEADELLGPIETRYLTWRPVSENRALAGTEEEDEASQPQEATHYTQHEIKLCLKCQQEAPRCTCHDGGKYVTLYMVSREVNDRRKGTRTEPVEALRECARCHSRTSTQDTEIATPISIASTTPLSLMTYELYRQLPLATHPEGRRKPGGGRKLLSFYDSRQGAARFAAFLQDVANQQNYRHIIPKAVRDLQDEKPFLPDLESLSQRCAQLAWDYRIFHNDPDTSEWRSTATHMSGAQGERLKHRVQTEIMAEFTTRRSDRQSLETLGLVGITYFEPGREPDFEPLARQIGLSTEQTRTLVEYLLDDLRQRKVIALPEGVRADAEVFGRNRFEWRLIRGGKTGPYEESWLGATERKQRRRIIRAMLHSHRVPAEDKDAVTALTAIWEWLVNESGVMAGRASQGYQLRHDRLFFRADLDWYRCDTCQRLNYRGTSLPCLQPHCNGTLYPYDVREMHRTSFFYHAFKRAVIPVRVEEHTAQLDSVKGREYQDGFRDGDINILSCSTTFEMGIDLGDLQAVMMSNVPPTVANYRQRSGRAGRRASGTAFILTWASDRPHDQTYFHAPSEIIRGRVRVPHIALENPYIRRRHVNAILLSDFLRYRASLGHEDLRQVGSFLDEQVASGTPHYSGLEQWLTVRGQEIRNQLELFAPTVAGDATAIDGWIDTFRADLAAIKAHYDAVAGYYRRAMETAKENIDLTNRDSVDEATLQIRQYQNLLERLQREDLINYVSDRGALPSYSFPLYTVELVLPHDKSPEHLRLQRDLRQAIREYAPGSEVVADKRIWRSGGLEFYRETPRAREYRICEICNHLQISPDAGMPLPNSDGECEICGTKPSGKRRKVLRFITPDGFRADPKRSGVPAKQYVHSEPNLMRSALLPRQSPNEQRLGSLIYYAYERDGQLLYVNEGILGTGFKVCLTCGTKLATKDTKCKGHYRGQPCPGELIDVVALGHVQKTDTLHLRFVSQGNVGVAPPEDMSFWLSLMYALIQGASRALQIERRDLDGVLSPRRLEYGRWEQTIVLYDDVPGGAGHVKRIQEEFVMVLREAIRVANCTDCAPETSCYHCLRDYSNQVYHSQLQRGKVSRFLEALHADLVPADTPVPGSGRVAAINLPRWLMRQVEQARQSVYLAANRLSSASPIGAARNWLDVLQELRRKGVSVDLFLIELSLDGAEKLSIARHLQVLMERGLKLWRIPDLPEWQVVLDLGLDGGYRAIRQVESGAFTLDADVGQSGLITTIHPKGVQQAFEALNRVHRTEVTSRELESPANVRVINLRPQPGKRVTEEQLFAEVFQQPVRSLFVNDPYLLDRERVVNRLGAYIRMAAQGGMLESVLVVTKRAGLAGTPGTPGDQDRAEMELNERCGGVVKFRHSEPQHDRFIEITRDDGSRARILIGQGLDFIQAGGTIKPTYIVIQDPFEG